MWGLAGAGYVSDDFWVAETFVRSGVVRAAADLSFRAPARPLVGPYFAFTTQVIGERPLLHALLLAALNGALAVAVWHALRAVVAPRTALVAALVFAVVPNRGATRLWFAVGSNVAGLLCVVVGAGLLLHRHRLVAATALFVAGTLFYEG